MLAPFIALTLIFVVLVSISYFVQIMLLGSTKTRKKFALYLLPGYFVYLWIKDTVTNVVFWFKSLINHYKNLKD